jgi:hypothetical protein
MKLESNLCSELSFCVQRAPGNRNAQTPAQHRFDGAHYRPLRITA